MPSLLHESIPVEANLQEPQSHYTNQCSCAMDMPFLTPSLALPCLLCCPLPVFIYTFIPLAPSFTTGFDEDPLQPASSLWALLLARFSLPCFPPPLVKLPAKAL